MKADQRGKYLVGIAGKQGDIRHLIEPGSKKSLCGLDLSWIGESAIRLNVLENTYAGRLCGLCAKAAQRPLKE